MMARSPAKFTKYPPFAESVRYHGRGIGAQYVPKRLGIRPQFRRYQNPPSVQADVEKRIRAEAEKKFKGKYTRLDLRFKNQFCYIDAYTDPVLTDSRPPADWPETRAEYAERLSNTPTHLCRLRYFGNDEWGFASTLIAMYELSMYDDGQFIGKPEQAFLISANVYLNE
jgi:hypothetical protein